MPVTQLLISSLIEVIREEGPFIFASAEDAAYFTKKTLEAPLKKREEKPLETISYEKVSLKAPPSAPPPPLLAEKPKPTAPEKKETPSYEIFSELEQILLKVAPEVLLSKQIPNDEIARKLSETWKTQNQLAPISILSFQEQKEQTEFLKQIAKALDVYFGPAKLVLADDIEKENRWDAFLSASQLKMVVACDHSLWQLTHLMGHYKEVPSQGKRFVGKVPLFLLPDLSLYLKDASLKRSLWKALVQACT